MDMPKYEILHELYEQCKSIDFYETSELVGMAQTKEEKDFFNIVMDFILQQKQKKVIAEKRF